MKFGQYGYATYHRARPLAPDSQFQRPLALGYPMSQPVGTVVAGGLGKKTKAVRKAERQAKRSARAAYEDRMQDAVNSMNEIIRKLRQGTLPSTAAMSVEVPTPPTGIKPTPRARKLRRKLEKLRGTPLANALDYARVLEDQKKWEDDRNVDHGDVSYEQPPTPPQTPPNQPPPDGGDTFIPPDDGSSVVGTDVSNVYYQVSPNEVDPPSTQVIVPQGFNTAQQAGATIDEVEEEPANQIEKAGDWIIWAGGIAGAGLAFWGIYEIVKARK